MSETATGTAHLGDPTGADRQATVLTGVCLSAVQMLQRVPGPVRRLRVGSGEVVVELEFDRSAEPIGTGAVGTGALATAPATANAVPGGGTPAVPPVPADADPDRHEVRSPMVGTFYVAPGPGERPFVRPGDTVRNGQQVGIVEAMKLMNAVDADLDGVVREVLVPDGTPVEYDQPLLLLSATRED